MRGDISHAHPHAWGSAVVLGHHATDNLFVINPDNAIASIADDFGDVVPVWYGRRSYPMRKRVSLFFFSTS
jgi:hypothetical protein